MLSKIINKEDISKLFPKTTKEIKNLVNNFINEAQDKLNKIIKIKSEDKTYENTIKAFDQLTSLSNIVIFSSCLHTLEMLSPEKEIRETAQEEILKIQDFFIEQFSNNVKLYHAIKDYYQNNSKQENLSKEQIYFIEETIQDYKRAGLDLPDEKLDKVRKLNKELAELELNFETNIAQDNRTIEVTITELAGCQKEFIDSLEKSGDKLILGIDYPTYFHIMDNCSVEKTREKLYLAFSNKAYPKNKSVLQNMIEKRDKLAKILGFKSYSHLDLDDEMAKNPETVQKFLETLYKKSEIKAQKEFELLKSNLPDSVTLTKNHKIKTWDSRYIKNQYKKQNLEIDEQEIANYFPTDKTIKELLDIYEQFFSLKFKISDAKNLWHPDVKLIEVYDYTSQNCHENNKKNLTSLESQELTSQNLKSYEQNHKPIGYLLIDLHPRENKFSHACQNTIISAVENNGPCICIVVANFPKNTQNKPALMQRDDVETFFHELGHALHSILGRTSIASFSGTNVKTDFVEMPSQMLEEWLSDKEILKKISSHYKTGEPLPDELIEKILKIKNFETGDFLQRQCFLATLSLEYFAENKENKNIDPKELLDNLTNKMRKNIEYSNQDNMYASFGHLTDYGAKYYSYMWSKVFALDMFNKIKTQGLLNPVAGKEYREKILAPGGSIDPNILLENFLGRKPSQDAFFKDLGI